MKLRIQGNSLRLRLTVAEVNEFGRLGHISDSINFGSDDSSRLIYSLISSEDDDRLQTYFHENRITVVVPGHISSSWVSGEEVGFSSENEPATDERAFVLVEKDFACLKKRPGEDESGKYPNPDSKGAC